MDHNNPTRNDAGAPATTATLLLELNLETGQLSIGGRLPSVLLGLAMLRMAEEELRGKFMEQRLQEDRRIQPAQWLGSLPRRAGN